MDDARQAGFPTSAGTLFGPGLGGFFEGIVLHHVNETVPPEQWVNRDVGFLVWGAVVAVNGRVVLRAGRPAASAEFARQERRRPPRAPHAGGRRHDDPPARQPA
jgi:uncharacterized membrane protein